MERINKKLLSILSSSFSKNITDEKNDDLNFFDSKVNLSALDMIYLVLLLEREFSIKFTEQDFDNTNFYTIKGMCETILSHITL